jgi:phosphatidylserine/phosphatidylglycerophosphate/cardiolipin synthase-like enzyme
MLRMTRRRLGAGLAAAAATALASAVLVPTAAHAASPYSLLILPDAGESAIYNFVDSAHSTIDVTMYEMRDTTLTTDLVNRQKAGARVRVILDAQHTSVNGAAFSALQAGGVSVEYSSSAFVYTHQKTITVDGATSWISTGTSTPPTTRPPATTRSSTPTPTTWPPSSRSSTPTSPRRRSPRRTATTWSGPPPTPRPTCSP